MGPYPAVTLAESQLKALIPSKLEQEKQERLLGLRHADSGKFFSFPTNGNFTVGRVSVGQSILPDMDFSPIQGFEAGVSRLHALINVSAEGVSITDLGSSNGSSVNGRKLDQHVEQKIENGDKIQFGRLTLEAIIRL